MQEQQRASRLVISKRRRTHLSCLILAPSRGLVTPTTAAEAELAPSPLPFPPATPEQLHKGLDELPSLSLSRLERTHLNPCSRQLVQPLAPGTSSPLQATFLAEQALHALMRFLGGAEDSFSRLRGGLAGAGGASELAGVMLVSM